MNIEIKFLLLKACFSVSPGCCCSLLSSSQQRKAANFQRPGELVAISDHSRACFELSHSCQRLNLVQSLLRPTVPLLSVRTLVVLLQSGGGWPKPKCLCFTILLRWLIRIYTGEKINFNCKINYIHLCVIAYTRMQLHVLKQVKPGGQPPLYCQHISEMSWVFYFFLEYLLSFLLQPFKTVSGAPVVTVVAFVQHCQEAYYPTALRSGTSYFYQVAGSCCII